MIENFSQLSPEVFKKELESGKYLLIDCRTPQELEIYGKISEDQILIDINNPQSIELIKKLDTEKKYLVYCWHGNRSQSLRDFMKHLGFTSVNDLSGGIDTWNKLY